MEWKQVEADTHVANIPGGMLVRSTTSNSTMVFVPYSTGQKEWITRSVEEWWRS